MNDQSTEMAVPYDAHVRTHHRRARIREWKRNYYAKNRERIRAYQKVYRATPERRRVAVERSSRWAESNRDHVNAGQRRRYAENREKALERGRARRAANPHKAREQTLRWRNKDLEHARNIEFAGHIRRKYNLTPAGYDNMLSAQGDACAICLSPFGDRKPHIDHNHATGAVRGLLCPPCNKTLGLSGENIDRLRGAIEYLLRHGGSVG